jgi:CBS domain-containing protein
MSSPVVGIQATETVRATLRKMIENRIGAVLVYRGSEVVGILTESDVVKRVLDGYQVLDMPVERVMSKPVITTERSTPVWKGFEIMLSKRIRRLPVIEEGKIVGIVTERDLFKWIVRITYEPRIPEQIRAAL